MIRYLNLLLEVVTFGEEVRRMTIERNDVKAVFFPDECEIYHLDCVPEEKWDELKEENFLFKDDWDINIFEFCSKCGRIL